MVRTRGRVHRAKEEKPWRTERRSRRFRSRDGARVADTCLFAEIVAALAVEALRGPSLMVGSCDRAPADYPTNNDEPGPQPSLAADARKNGDIKPAASPHPVSAGYERPRRTGNEVIGHWRTCCRLLRADRHIPLRRRARVEVGAECVSSARSDLCGGWSAMAISTAINIPARKLSRRTPPSWPVFPLSKADRPSTAACRDGRR
jgi:hypothetical protein